MNYANPMPCRVRGDWMPEGKSYPARLAGRWNGWAIPLVDAETAELICKDQKLLLGEDDPDLHWEFGVIVFNDGEDGVREIGPNEDGLYDVGFGWVWETVDEVAGEGPTDAQRKAFDAYNEHVFFGRALSSWACTVNADGSHTFRLSVNDGSNVTGRGNCRSVHVADVTIRPCGRTTVEKA